MGRRADLKTSVQRISQSEILAVKATCRTLSGGRELLLVRMLDAWPVDRPSWEGGPLSNSWSVDYHNRGIRDRSAWLGIINLHPDG
jgi:hypothetical protein